MTEGQLEQAMRALGPRGWAGLVGATLALTLLAAWLYLLQPSLAQYRELADSASPFAIADAETRAAENDGAIAAIGREVQSLREQLYGSSSALPLEQIESYVIDRLDRLSVPRGVQLVSVTPGEPGEVLMFDELPYDVDVRGEYFALHEWLRAVEEDLRPMVVKRFEMSTGPRDEAVAMKLRLVSYRPRGEGT